MNLYRSMLIERLPDDSLFKILERLVEEGYLQNNRKLGVNLYVSLSSRFVEVICSMKNLESLGLGAHDLTPDVLAHVFQSCSKITNLFVSTKTYKTLEMAEHLKNQLKSGFQKLRYFIFECSIDNDTWPVIQEMLT